MALSGNLENAQDFLNKLLEEGNDLQGSITSRSLVNFAMTAYHLREWITNGAYPSAMKEDAERLFAVPEYLACRDIANGSKHFALNKAPSTKSVRSQSGFGVGRFGHGPFGIGEESIRIEMNDGTTWSVLEFKDRVMAMWQSLFAAHGYPC